MEGVALGKDRKENISIFSSQYFYVKCIGNPLDSMLVLKALPSAKKKKKKIFLC